MLFYTILYILGKVVEAKALNLKRPDESSIVAVKMLKEGHTDVEMVDLVSEMDMMKVNFIRSYNLVSHCTFPKVHLSIGVLAPTFKGVVFPLAISFGMVEVPFP